MNNSNGKCVNALKQSRLFSFGFACKVIVINLIQVVVFFFFFFFFIFKFQILFFKREQQYLLYLITVNTFTSLNNAHNMATMLKRFHEIVHFTFCLVICLFCQLFDIEHQKQGDLRLIRKKIQSKSLCGRAKVKRLGL